VGGIQVGRRNDFSEVRRIGGNFSGKERCSFGLRWLIGQPNTRYIGKGSKEIGGSREKGFSRMEKSAGEGRKTGMNCEKEPAIEKGEWNGAEEGVKGTRRGESQREERKPDKPSGGQRKGPSDDKEHYIGRKKRR